MEGILAARLRERIISLITLYLKRPKLGEPHSHPEAKGSLPSTHSTQGGPVRGQSLTLNDTLTLLNNSGVF